MTTKQEKVEAALNEILKSGGFEAFVDDEVFIMDEVIESPRRSLSSDGTIQRVATRRTQQRRAARTTGMSSLERRKRARKAVKTKKRDASGMRKAVKRRNKTMRKRRRMGIK